MANNKWILNKALLGLYCISAKESPNQQYQFSQSKKTSPKMIEIIDVDKGLKRKQNDVLISVQRNPRLEVPLRHKRASKEEAPISHFCTMKSHLALNDIVATHEEGEEYLGLQSIDITKNELFRALKEEQALTQTRTPMTLSDLPTFAMLEIISFLYDDFVSISRMFKICKRNLDHMEIRKHVRASILDTPEKATCRICCKAVCYPYRLVECGHEVCGRCAWKQQRQSCGCGAHIISRPELQHPMLAEYKAFWMLSEKANFRRLTRNEKPVHCGSAGFFGSKGVPNRLEPFCGVGFISDFNDTPVLDLSRMEHANKLPSGKEKRLWITLCPVQNNYSAFSISTMPAHQMKQLWSKILHRFHPWFCSLNRRDVILLGEDATTAYLNSADTSDSRFEVRLVGWEHFARG